MRSLFSHALIALTALTGCEPESSFPTPSTNTNQFDAVDMDTDSDDDLADDDNGGGNNGGGDNGGGDNGGGPLSGGDLYVQSCKGCHGKDGEGSDSAPALAGEIDTLTDSELTDIILNGTGTMPAPGLSADEADTLVEWLRNAW